MERIKLTSQVRNRYAEVVRNALDTNPAAVEKAISVLYERQTRDEKQDEVTRHDNMVGVRHNHARRIAYYGRWIASGRRLTGHHLDKARQIAHVYARSQLAELAAVKAGAVQG